MSADSCLPDQFLKYYPTAEHNKPTYSTPARPRYPVAQLNGDPRPLTLHVLPTERSPVAGEGRPPSNTVDILSDCSPGWCFVKMGSVTGWVTRDRLAGGYGAATAQKPVASERPRDDAPPPRAVSVITPPRGPDIARAPRIVTVPPAPRIADAAPPRRSTDAPPPQRIAEASPPPPEPKPAPESSKKFYVLQFKEGEGARRDERKSTPVPPPGATTTEIRKTAPQRTANAGPEALSPSDAPGDLAISDIKRKTYSIVGLGKDLSLPVHVYHDGNSPIVGSIPATAVDIEAAGICVEEWCLVRRGTLRGWIKRRYLTDNAVAASQPWSYDGIAP